MNQMTSRACVGAEDLSLLIQFATRATRARWPLSTYKRVGDMVWAGYNLEQSENVRLWFDAGDLVAYAFFDPTISLEFDIMPGITRYDLVGDEILEWGERRRRALRRSGNESLPKAFAMLGYKMVTLTMTLTSDTRRLALLERRGYLRADGFDVMYRRNLDGDLSARQLEPSLRLRHATASDLVERVDVHRDAWSVWGPSAATVEDYGRLRNAPIYDPELDVVLEDARGRFLAYCIGWLDVANRSGNFEPVGCRPAFTRRGYARAVVTECMRRMQARGMHTALVSTASVNQPARALYQSCGFVEEDRAYQYTKSVSQ
jgi:ribosomal protein S18 acetylase RimI-like enzyme